MNFIAGDVIGLGGIGFVYYSVWGAIFSWIIFIIFALLAIIGLITVIRFFFGGRFGNRKKRGETDGEYWLRTGKIKK